MQKSNEIFINSHIHTLLAIIPLLLDIVKDTSENIGVFTQFEPTCAVQKNSLFEQAKRTSVLIVSCKAFKTGV